MGTRGWGLARRVLLHSLDSQPVGSLPRTRSAYPLSFPLTDPRGPAAFPRLLASSLSRASEPAQGNSRSSSRFSRHVASSIGPNVSGTIVVTLPGAANDPALEADLDMH